jgi:hypothetical protein
MSAMVELNGKAGRVCPQAQSGEIRCPCIVRTNSEDVLTGEVFGQLRHIRPHLWLGPLLNIGLAAETQRKVWYKNLQIRLWERQDRFPPELLGFKEGRTEPDIIIEFENPATTIFIEAKYTSPLAESTTHSENNNQVLRGVRTLLAATGHVQSNPLFSMPKRRPIWLALMAYKPDSLVDRYRDRDALARHLDGIVERDDLPVDPFVGTITWKDIAQVLMDRLNQMTPAEKSITRELDQYIQHKMTLPM